MNSEVTKQANEKLKISETVLSCSGVGEKCKIILHLAGKIYCVKQNNSTRIRSRSKRNER